jgi:hypothetical protein
LSPASASNVGTSDDGGEKLFLIKVLFKFFTNVLFNNAGKGKIWVAYRVWGKTREARLRKFVCKGQILHATGK